MGFFVILLLQADVTVYTDGHIHFIIIIIIIITYTFCIAVVCTMLCYTMLMKRYCSQWVKKQKTPALHMKFK